MKFEKKTGEVGFTLVEIMIVVAIIGLLSAIAVPNFVKARATSQKNACISNLHQIDSAVQEWALENHQPPNATVVVNGIIPYLGRGTSGSLKSCFCPADPTTKFANSYLVTTVDVAPTCQIAAATHILN